MYFSVNITAAVHHWRSWFCGITLMTIFPVFLLASMCLWASTMSSRLNVLSITGLKEAGWSEKCGNTLCMKAFTRSALYCEGKMKSKNQVQLRTCKYKRHVKPDPEKGSAVEFSLDVSQHVPVQRWRNAAGVSFLFEFSPEGCESGGGCWAGGLAWRAVCPADLPLPPCLPWSRTAPTCRRWLKSSHFAPSYTHQCSQGWHLLLCLWNDSFYLYNWTVRDSEM